MATPPMKALSLRLGIASKTQRCFLTWHESPQAGEGGVDGGGSRGGGEGGSTEVLVLTHPFIYLFF